MKNVAQITHEELLELIILKLTGDGHALKEGEFAVQFVTSADGKTSALISGLVKESDFSSQLLPATTPAEEEALEEVPEGLARSTRVALQVALTFKPQTQEKLVKGVLQTLVQQTGVPTAEPSMQMKRQVNALVILALQAWAEEGKVVYVDEIDGWHKKRAPKSTAAQAAADVLGGSGGAMGRGDALGAGITD